MTNRRRMDDAYISIRPRSSDCGCVYGCLASSVRSRLSLSQRERMKVRDCFAVAPRVRTRLLATRYRALGESDVPESQHDNSMASQKFRARSVANLACTVVMSSAVQLDSQLCVRAIEIQDVIVEWMLAAKFMPPQNFDSVSVAKEYVRAQSPSFAAIERDPSVHFNSSTRLAKRRFRTPLTSILSPQAGRGGYASAFNVEC